MTNSEIIIVAVFVWVIAFALSMSLGRGIGKYAKIAEWIPVDGVDARKIYVCSHCHCKRRHKRPYCDECSWLMENAVENQKIMLTEER